MAISKIKKSAAARKAPAKKGQPYECRVCGYRVVVDNACGCDEEHVFICCDQPMGRAASGKAAAKPAARKPRARKAR
jgi:hypothetical protein